MIDDEGKLGKEAVLRGLNVNGLYPTNEQIIPILEELLKEKIYRIIDDQTRVFRPEKLHAVIEEFKKENIVTEVKNVRAKSKK